MQSSPSHTELITKLNAGDEPAFSFVYELYSNAVFANICKLIKNREQGKDILQEVFILLWNNRQKLTAKQDIGGWLFTTSYYKSLEYLRRDIKKGIVELSDSLAEQLAEERLEDAELNYSQQVAVLHSAIELLPPQKKAAFTLCRIQGLSYEVAAAEMGVSAETIKGYIKDSLKIIRNYAVSQQATTSAFSISCLILFIR